MIKKDSLCCNELYLVFSHLCRNVLFRFFKPTCKLFYCPIWVHSDEENQNGSTASFKLKTKTIVLTTNGTDLARRNPHSSLDVDGAQCEPASSFMLTGMAFEFTGTECSSAFCAFVNVSGATIECSYEDAAGKPMISLDSL